MPTRRKEKQALHCTSMGSLGAAAPKPGFAYFCLAAKVGRARGHETSLPFGKTKRKWGVELVPRAGARNLSWQGFARNTPCPGARNLPRQRQKTGGPVRDLPADAFPYSSGISRITSRISISMSRFSPLRPTVTNPNWAKNASVSPPQVRTIFSRP